VGSESSRGALAGITNTDRRVLVLAFARTADAFGNSFLVVVLPLYVAGPIDLGGLAGVPVPLAGSLTGALAIGIALSAFSVASSLAQPLVGRLSDRTGRRRAFVLCGLVVLAAVNAAYVFTEGYPVVLGLRVLGGVGAALTIPPTVALIDDVAPDARGESFGVFNAARLLGFGVGPVVAGAIVSVDRYAVAGRTVSGFDVAFVVAAAAAALGFVLVARFVRDPEDLTSAGTERSLAAGDPGGDEAGRSVLAAGVASFAIAAVLAGFAPLENAINARLDQGSTVFAIQFAAGVLATISLQAPIGRASDRYGRRPFLLAGFALLVPATLAQGFVFDSLSMLVARFGQGVAVTLVYTPALALAGDLAGTGGTAGRLATVTTAYGLGVAVGPIVAGALVGYGFATPFVVGAALGVCSFGLVYVGVEESASGS
jgi:MFS family permease